MKRRLREAVRLEWLPRCREAAPLDALFRAHREAYGAPFATLAETIAGLAASQCSDDS